MSANNLNTAAAEVLAVLLWHEIVGHNVDGRWDSEAFDAMYETPVKNAMDLAKRQKTCSDCFGSNGEIWKIKNKLEEHMCRCSINTHAP